MMVMVVVMVVMVMMIMLLLLLLMMVVVVMMIWKHSSIASPFLFTCRILWPTSVLRSAFHLPPSCHIRRLPLDECALNPNTVLAVTERGGHVAFMENMWPFSQAWMDKVTAEFLTPHLCPPRARL